VCPAWGAKIVNSWWNNDVNEHRSQTVWDRFVLAYTTGILRVLSSDCFSYVIAPAFSTLAFSTPAFSVVSCYLLLYVVYIYQKLLNFMDAFNCYKQKWKLASFNLAYPVTKTAESTITNLAKGIVHHESWLYQFNIRSKVKDQSHMVTNCKNIFQAWRRSSGRREFAFYLVYLEGDTGILEVLVRLHIPKIVDRCSHSAASRPERVLHCGSSSSSW